MMEHHHYFGHDLSGAFLGLLLLPLRILLGERPIRLLSRLARPAGKKNHISTKKHIYYLESILESPSNTAIVATDEQLRIKYFNAEAERLLGLPKKQAIGRSLEKIHERLRPGSSRDLGRIWKRLCHRGSHHFEMWYLEHYLDIQVSALRAEDNTFVGLVFMGRDITSLKKAEEEREKTLRRLQQAERMETVGLLAGGVAHDLNNILSAIINYPELLLAKISQDSELREPLQTILAAGKRAAAVVDDLLTMARGGTMTRQTLWINDLVADYLESLEFRKISAHHPGVHLHFSPDPNLWACHCSPIHITKVVMNLINNAFEAVEEQGDVFIRTVNESGDRDNASSVILEIRDTGPGISPEDRDKIFEPFYSTKTLGRSGSGLGLAVVWNVIHAHGGTITLESDQSGSTFTIRLPAWEWPHIEQSPVDRSEKNHHRHGGSVLVVDDLALQRKITEEMLTFLGYRVITVESGEEALIHLHNHAVDVVLLDMMLNGMNGYETLLEIFRLQPNQFVLMVSGYSENEELDNALAAGAAGFLKKPYSLADLSMALAGRAGWSGQGKHSGRKQCVRSETSTSHLN